MKDSYCLWVSQGKENEWACIGTGTSIFTVNEILNIQTMLSVNAEWKGSLFKITKVGDVSWMNYLPSNIMRGGIVL